MKNCLYAYGNVSMYEAAPQVSEGSNRGIAGRLWAWLLNVLNLADAGLHVLYMVLCAGKLC